MRANLTTSADHGWPLRLAFVAQRLAAAELHRW